MPPHPLATVEIQKYYPNKLKFNGVYSRNICYKSWWEQINKNSLGSFIC